jgi:tetratricopeptide (TPR) repeat protein
VNDERDAEVNSSSELWPRASIWDVLIAEDETELDVEALAAYAEGRLNTQRREQIRRMIARSPKAMEMLDALHAVGREEYTGTEPAATVRPTEQTVVPRAAWGRSLVMTLTLAASILLAVSTTYLAWLRSKTVNSLQGQVAALDDQLSRQRHDSLLARKEQLVLLAGQTPMMTGEMTPALVQLALADGPVSRSPDELSEAEKEQRDAQLHRLLVEADQLLTQTSEETARRGVQAASLELAAGREDAALNRIDELIARSGETPELLNVRAAILAQQASRMRLEEARRALEESESILSQIGQQDPDFAPAWFNLALVRERLGKSKEAQSAWQEYVKHETSPEFRQLAREFREVEN